MGNGRGGREDGRERNEENIQNAGSSEVQVATGVPEEEEEEDSVAIIKKLFSTPDGDRTHNLPLRRRAPYPLGHGGNKGDIIISLLLLLCYFVMIINMRVGNIMLL